MPVVSGMSAAVMPMRKVPPARAPGAIAPLTIAAPNDAARHTIKRVRKPDDMKRGMSVLPARHLDCVKSQHLSWPGHTPRRAGALCDDTGKGRAMDRLCTNFRRRQVLKTT